MLTSPIGPSLETPIPNESWPVDFSDTLTFIKTLSGLDPTVCLILTR